jgi:hypothetical protein
MNLILLIGLWIMALCFFIGGITKLRTSEADYQDVQIQYDKVYLAKYGRTSLKIVLENRKDAYYIYEDLLPDKMDWRQAIKLLEKSSSATLWLEENGWVGGIKTEHLTIPPSRGVEVEHEDGKWALWWSAFWFVAGIGFYLYMKWYFKEEWMDGTVPQHSNDEILKLDLTEDRNRSTTPPPSNNDEIIKLDLK